MSTIIRKLSRLIGMNLNWLRTSQLSWRTRLSYYAHGTIAVARDRLTGKKWVRHLGQSFFYDSPITPLLLMQYPKELQDRIIENATDPIRTVLDIGGNIGQFSATLHKLAPDLESIDIFEPNPAIFSLLEKNVTNLPGATAFNLGIGPAGLSPFYFTPGYSAVGSLIANNAMYRPSSELTVSDVKLVSDVSVVTGRRHYDLVKIDVEGFEYEVVEAIENLAMRYLFIEITGPAKEKSHTTSELFALLRKKFGAYEVRFQSQGDSDSTVFEMLLEFSQAKGDSRQDPCQPPDTQPSIDSPQAEADGPSAQQLQDCA